MTLLTILGILFISLIILVPLIERFGPRPDNAQLQKIRRWIFPLFAILMVLQLIIYLVA